MRCAGLLVAEIKMTEYSKVCEHKRKLKRIDYSKTKALWITEDGSVFDLTDDTGFGNEEHVGFLAASYDPVVAKKIGLSKKEVNFLRGYYRYGDSKRMYYLIIKKVLSKNTRVRVFENQIVIQGGRLTKHVKDIVLDISLAQHIKNPHVIYEDNNGKSKVINIYQKE